MLSASQALLGPVGNQAQGMAPGQCLTHWQLLSLLADKEAKCWVRAAQGRPPEVSGRTGPQTGGGGPCRFERPSTAAGDGHSAGPRPALQAAHCSSALTHTGVFVGDRASRSPLHHLQEQGPQRGGQPLRFRWEGLWPAR